MGLPQTLSSEESINGYRGSANGFISQAMQDLIPWRVFEISSMELEIYQRDNLKYKGENLQQIHMQS